MYLPHPISLACTIYLMDYFIISNSILPQEAKARSHCYQTGPNLSFCWTYKSRICIQFVLINWKSHKKFLPCQIWGTPLWSECKQTLQSLHWYLALVPQTGCTEKQESLDLCKWQKRGNLYREVRKFELWMIWRLHWF